MAAASLFPGADPFVAAQTFWLVTVDVSQGSVSSRLLPGTVNGLTQTFITISAATSAQAASDARAEGYTVSDVQGPYSSAGAAAASQAAQTAQAQAATQAGTIPGGGVIQDVKNAASTTLGAIDAVPKFLSRLTSANLWMRVGEVVAGLILLAIGVNSLFKGKPLAAVTTVAGKVAPLAMA